jgi:SAM-dependent methyltransferase
MSADISERIPIGVLEDRIVSYCDDPGCRLQCPRCRTDLAGFDCRRCSFQLRFISGIAHALPPERIAYYARFIEDYERIRAEEGRGSEDEDFYLGLPYRDSTGKNSGQWQIRARSYNYLIENVLRPFLPSGGERILDLGSGNCWMSFRLALAGYSPFAVDLLTNDRDGLGAAKHYRKHLHSIFPRFQAELARLPFQDEQFDAAIFNASFHYAEDYEVALSEALRCVQAGGIVVISDTPWYSKEESGLQMVAERRAAFLERYDTASDSIKSLEFLTDERLGVLADRLSIEWTNYSIQFGFKWRMRPFMAKLRKSREPSQFRLYIAKKAPVNEASK